MVIIKSEKLVIKNYVKISKEFCWILFILKLHKIRIYQYPIYLKIIENLSQNIKDKEKFQSNDSKK